MSAIISLVLKVTTLETLLRFLLRHADADLTTLISETVPPVDIHRVGIFRGACAKYDKKAMDGLDAFVVVSSLQALTITLSQMVLNCLRQIHQQGRCVGSSLPGARCQGTGSR